MSEYVITVYRTVQQRVEVEFSTDIPLEIDESIIEDKLKGIIHGAINNIGEGEWETIEVDEHTFNTKEIKDV
tara:strand:- start:876 stop:1091 length:216 start_codon:yes stop_codon:yes gene_type:complete